MNDSMTRRNVLAISGIGLLAGAVAIPTAEAKTAALTAGEEANIKFVERFMEALSAKSLDVDALVATYFAPNASVRWTDDSPPMHGATATVAAAKALMPAGAWVEIKMLDIFAKGPLVATSRIDVLKTPGKPDVPFGIAGVHIIKDGKFIEYIDYIVK